MMRDIGLPNMKWLAKVFIAAALLVLTAGTPVSAQTFCGLGEPGFVCKTLPSASGPTLPAMRAQFDAISVGDFEAVCDGVTDDKTHFQNAWNYAASVGKNLKVSGVGPVCYLSGGITQPTLSGGTTGANGNGNRPTNVSFLVGDGSSSVTLLSGATGCAITITATYGTQSYLGNRMGGFGLKQQSNTLTGQGICLNDVTQLTITDVYVAGFADGIYGLDTISLNIYNSYIQNNNVCIYGAAVSNAPPNAWNIAGNLLENCAQYTVFLAAPSQGNIWGNTIQSNGGGTSPNTIEIAGCNAGGAALTVNVEGNYFEANIGTGEVVIAQLAGTVPCLVTVKNNSFARTTSSLTHMIYISNTGTGLTTVVTGGNSFFNVGGYTPSSARKYMDVASGATTNYQFLNCADNAYTSATEMQAICQTPIANSIAEFDSSAQFQGYSASAVGTAAFQNTGTSGHTIPFLDGTNVWGGSNTFPACDVIISGSGSGSSTLCAPATGGGTNTMPRGTAQILGTSDAVVTYTPADPTGTTSTSGKMMGLAASLAACFIVPVNSTRAVLTISGNLTNSNAGDAASAQLYYADNASIAAPANAASPTGTALGNPVTFNANAGGSNPIAPFSITIPVTGLTPGHTYWFDLLAFASAGTAQPKSITCSAFEM
jgi:hypothetical protein